MRITRVIQDTVRQTGQDYQELFGCRVVAK